jgi:hypothetical protein
MSALDNFDNLPARTLQDYLQIACPRQWWLILPLFVTRPLVATLHNIQKRCA